MASFDYIPLFNTIFTLNGECLCVDKLNGDLQNSAQASLVSKLTHICELFSSLTRVTSSQFVTTPSADINVDNSHRLFSSITSQASINDNKKLTTFYHGVFDSYAEMPFNRTLYDHSKTDDGSSQQEWILGASKVPIGSIVRCNSSQEGSQLNNYTDNNSVGPTATIVDLISAMEARMSPHSDSKSPLNSDGKLRGTILANAIKMLNDTWVVVGTIFRKVKSATIAKDSNSVRRCRSRILLQIPLHYTSIPLPVECEVNVIKVISSPEQNAVNNAQTVASRREFVLSQVGRVTAQLVSNQNVPNSVAVAKMAKALYLLSAETDEMVSAAKREERKQAIGVTEDPVNQSALATFLELLSSRENTRYIPFSSLAVLVAFDDYFRNPNRVTSKQVIGIDGDEPKPKKKSKGVRHKISKMVKNIVNPEKERQKKHDAEMLANALKSEVMPSWVGAAKNEDRSNVETGHSIVDTTFTQSSDKILNPLSPLLPTGEEQQAHTNASEADANDEGPDFSDDESGLTSQVTSDESLIAPLSKLAFTSLKAAFQQQYTTSRSSILPNFQNLPKIIRTRTLSTTSPQTQLHTIASISEGDAKQLGNFVNGRSQPANNNSTASGLRIPIHLVQISTSTQDQGDNPSDDLAAHESISKLLAECYIDTK